ncbi:sigma-70 family RNA polymerase sigma factor [Clostridium sp. KNHs216]|uniref:RNA polymerase sigma factor n=1 Tax=Clostridium sp. KNHs216 TaxID=1550235 RepID=UPI0011522CB5|nr:sigma-70 family RNA polymerase sigma factor [Clostridium sp. KNHs216]TQI65405.1 RNA polymerase sigma-70 factor (ECF subfamily) [Clostridium sp. KNHs216]
MRKQIPDDLKECIEKNKESMYRLAYSYTKSREAALDVIQETVVHALEKAHTLRDPCKMKNWVFRILVNESVSWYRKNRRTVSLSEQDEVPLQDTTAEVAEALDVYRAVQALNPELKAVIILRYYEDMRLEDIAKITHTPLNTVKSRLRRGLDQIRKYL